MAILVNENTKVLIQGITGRVGSFQTKIMLEYGTKIVAGVTPGKGGMDVHGVPVYDFVCEALEKHEVNAAISFVPARFAYDAAMEVIANAIPLYVLLAEGIPLHDTLKILNYAATRGVKVIGPDTPGVVSPGKCKLGVHPNQVLHPGCIGIVSRSGALSYEICRVLKDHGFGQSTVVGIGGGPLWGTTQEDVLRLFQNDPALARKLFCGEHHGAKGSRFY
ncbi:MAG: succinate--CoA ligase subunit alpha [Candidatus Bathyarchaeia archaeon]